MGNIPYTKYMFLKKGILLFPRFESLEFLSQNKAQNRTSVNIHTFWDPLHGRVYITFYTSLTTKTSALKSIIVKCVFLGSSKLKFVVT